MNHFVQKRIPQKLRKFAGSVPRYVKVSASERVEITSSGCLSLASLYQRALAKHHSLLLAKSYDILLARISGALRQTQRISPVFAINREGLSGLSRSEDSDLTFVQRGALAITEFY